MQKGLDCPKEIRIIKQDIGFRADFSLYLINSHVRMRKYAYAFPVSHR